MVRERQRMHQAEKVTMVIAGAERDYYFDFEVPKKLTKKKHIKAYADGLSDGAAAMLDRIEVGPKSIPNDSTPSGE